ncbi:MAG: PEP-CTERM sorting domain-containing protein [Sedimentisphaerales bacterium]|nr:PEP-CTERM sorting domain-containing protein [Sedimentisphaerales bacterium]
MRKCVLVFLLLGLMASVASATSDWEGDVSNDWADGENWSDGGPSETERRDIALNGPYGPPVVSADSTAGVIHMGRTNTGQTIENSTLTISAGTLTVASAGNELVSVSYDNTTNNLVVDGGNLVVYHNGGAGTGEIRLQHVANTASVGYLYLYSGSIDTEQLNLGSRDGLGTFIAEGGTLTIRRRIDKFGLVETNSAYGFNLGGATLEMAGLTDRDSVIGDIGIGTGGASDFFMDSTSTVVFDLGLSANKGGVAGIDWDQITSNGNYTLDGELMVRFLEAASVDDYWDVWTVNSANASLYSGSGDLDALTLPDNIVASWIDTGNGTDTLRLTYIPEPATIALLGLGLLAIRRRNRK